MALGDIVGKLPIPNIGIGAVSIVKVISYLIIFVIFCILAGVLTYIWFRNRKFNKRVWVFERIGGRIELVSIVRAMITKIGDAGDTVLYVRGYKKFLPTPSIQQGRNIYWFFIREDKEWINFGLEDLDEKMREMGAYFLDKEMRHVRSALVKNLRERFQKLTFLEKYGGLIVWTGLCIVIGICVWLWFDKMIELSGVAQQAMEVGENVLGKADGVIAKLDRICTGSGIG